MIKKIIFSFLIFLSLALSSCEKDDICDANTPTTPRLIVKFFDINSPTTAKNVTNLKVIGSGMTTGIVFNATATGDAKYLTNANSIAIPLKPDADAVTYSFILNSGNSNAALISQDDLIINYTRQEIFVSRACGYKTVFNLKPSPFTQTAVPSTNNFWMKTIVVEKNNIDNETDTHVKIFF